MDDVIPRLNAALSGRYRLVRQLGEGGMATVYLADDLRHERKVAIKVLKPELAAVIGAERFLAEIKTTANLQHPHILPLFDSGEADGFLFYVMPYVEGETLREKLDREGDPPIHEAIRILREIVDALAHAHANGIVHRDVKPANVMLAGRHAVVTDFGVAKAIDDSAQRTQETATGMALGTPTYMSPEQAGADPDVDHRADIYAAGVIAYELLTGTPPFRGRNARALLVAHLTGEPEPLRSVRDTVPMELDRAVMKCLRKQPTDRWQRAEELMDVLEAAITPSGQAARESAPRSRWRSVARTLVSVAVVVGLLVGIGWTVSRSFDRQWARGEAVLEISQLAEAGEFAAALRVSQRALELLPDHPVIDSLVDVVSQSPSIESEPAGARVFYKEYSDPESSWVDFGTTPVSERRVPRGKKRWRLAMEGFDPVDVTAGGDAVLDLPLAEEGTIPDGMVRVPRGTAGAFVTSIGPLTSLPYSDYFIDRYEVRNEQFKEFVDAGGYEREEYWTHEFVADDRSLSWSEAMERFEDATGRPGPATWELGRPKPGEESLPVTGVSWYEAAAYAEFRGKSLPTLRHWVRAAGTGEGGSIIPLSNFDGEGPATAGTFQGMSPSGAFDMAGNVREWILNSAGDRRHAVGGAWSDPTYFFSGPNVQSPFDRLPVNGFRLAQYTRDDDFGGQADVDMPLVVRDYMEERPVSDEVFQAYVRQFDYDPAPLDAVVEERLEYEFGSVEVVSYEGVGWGRIRAFLYLPAGTSTPYQIVLWFPGSGAAIAGPDPDPRDVAGRIEHFVASGRAVLRPIFRGTYSRADPDQPPGMNTTWPEPTREYVDLVRSWVSETRRSVDYLQSRPEIDADRIAYYGTSWGGRLAAIIPAVEPRFKVNLVVIGGLASGAALPEVDQINYVSRITVPTLMLNGRYDPLEPVEDSQLPMFHLLGTPEAHKRHVIYEGFGHGVPRNELIAETLDWLDEYFGPPR